MRNVHSPKNDSTELLYLEDQHRLQAEGNVISCEQRGDEIALVVNQTLSPSPYNQHLV